MTEPESLSLSLNSVTENSAYLSLSRWHLKRVQDEMEAARGNDRDPRGGDAFAALLASTCLRVERDRPIGRGRPATLRHLELGAILDKHWMFRRPSFRLELVELQPP